MELRNKTFEIKSVDRQARSIEAVFSTESVDSYGEVVKQDWRLERFRKNPVLLLQHKTSSFLGSPADALPIGTVRNIGVRNGALQGTVVFASADASPLADQVFKLFAEGVMKAFSVGFKPNSISTEKRDGHEITVLSDNELYEVSAVSLPANADAVAKALGGRPGSLLTSTQRVAARASAKAKELTAKRPSIVQRAREAAEQAERGTPYVPLPSGRGALARKARGAVQAAVSGKSAPTGSFAARARAKAEAHGARIVKRDFPPDAA